MTREHSDRLQDILVALRKCQSYMSRIGGADDDMAYDAIVRNLEIIGEATSKIPHDLRDTHPEIPWSKVIGLRNILIHQYFSADRQLIEAIIQNDLSELARALIDILN
jgi:uncharacterized protein with HEPN domain